MITENISTLKIHKLTQEQYNRELEAGRIDESALYLTPDDGSEYATVEQLDTKAGLKIADGGEIFNDYVNNTASGEYSHAEGEGTITTSEA